MNFRSKRGDGAVGGFICEIGRAAILKRSF
jgi:hypothetical protein